MPQWATAMAQQGLSTALLWAPLWAAASSAHASVPPWSARHWESRRRRRSAARALSATASSAQQWALTLGAPCRPSSPRRPAHRSRSQRRSRSATSCTQRWCRRRSRAGCRSATLRHRRTSRKSLAPLLGLSLSSTLFLRKERESPRGGAWSEVSRTSSRRKDEQATGQLCKLFTIFNKKITAKENRWLMKTSTSVTHERRSL